MKLINYMTDALHNLAHSKLRSALALLGILVGTASVVAMVSGGELATHEALKQFKSLGTDLLAVSVNSASDNTSETSLATDLTLNNLEIMQHVVQRIEATAPYTQVFHSIAYNGQPINGMVLGVTDHFFDVLKIQMQEGRIISILDKYSLYCVIGQDIFESLTKILLKNPIGQTIQIGHHYFTIVGVASRWPENSFVYTDINTAILIPLMSSMMISKYATINNLVLRLAPNADINSVEENIKRTMMTLAPGHQVSFRSAKELIAKMQNQSNILTIFLALISSVSLIVGGIGVMNIMLVSVVERRREIGIRRAIGARRYDIHLLFLTESIVLSLLGGLAGVVLGMLITYFVARISHWEFIFLYKPACVGFIVSVLVGIISGLYPAWQASKLSPIDALRLV